MSSHSTACQELFFKSDECVIYAFRLVGDARDNFIESPCVVVPRSLVPLMCNFVSVSSPWRDKGGVVAIVGMERDAMIPIPAIENRFLCVSGHSTSLMEWRLGMVSFSLCECIQGLEIDRSSWLVVSLLVHITI